MSASVRHLRYPFCALTASLFLLLLFAFASHANPTVEIPLPVNIPVPATVLHTDNFGYAFQYTYPMVMRQWEDGRKEEWAIEGMAEAAIKSYPTTTMKRSPYYGEYNLQKVDRPLTVGIPRDGNVEEYLAQDFWVYVGSNQGRDLGYLHGILALGGANHLDHFFAFKTIFHQSFSDLYWGWVKNQAIENRYAVGAGTGTLCQLSDDALHTRFPAEFLASRTYFPYDTGSAFDHLPPLTAKVIELKFGNKTSATITTGYRDCVGIQDPINFAACQVVAKQSLRVKIYQQGESQCWNEALPGVTEEGVRRFDNINDLQRYFVVVANVHPREFQGYYLAIE